uniref:Uncharacterized protein n=1 Tax=Arundo donax TaxID=35708 RepID=A0A0A9DX93_ARUDO
MSLYNLFCSLVIFVDFSYSDRLEYSVNPTCCHLLMSAAMCSLKTIACLLIS